MAKTWVLDTETKGTGAHIAPLPDAGVTAAVERELALVRLRRPQPQGRPASEPPEPLRFRVVDVMSGGELGRDIDARATVGLLEQMRSVLDARIFVRPDGARRWRLLSVPEQKLLWGFRRDAQPSDAAPATGA